MDFHQSVSVPRLTKKPDDFAATGLEFDSAIELLLAFDRQASRLTDKFQIR